MRTVPAAVVLLLLSGCHGCGADNLAADRPGALRLVTWNVHNLFDEVDRLDKPGADDDVPSPAEVEDKLALVGAVIARLGADLVVLQEVENLAILDRLRRGPLAGAYQGAYLVDGFDPRGIDVAVLARAPLDGYVSHLGERDERGRTVWSRDCVEAHSAAPSGARFVLLGNHFISRLGPNDARRTTQAEHARRHADELRAADPRALVVVAGDLNDEAQDPALAPLLADGAYVDAGAGLAEDAGWTWSGSQGRSRFDHVIVPSAAREGIVRVEVADGADIAAASDHRPVVVDFRLGR